MGKLVALLNVWRSTDVEMLGLGVMVRWRGSLFMWSHRALNTLFCVLAGSAMNTTFPSIRWVEFHEFYFNMLQFSWYLVLTHQKVLDGLLHPSDMCCYKCIVYCSLNFCMLNWKFHVLGEREREREWQKEKWSPVILGARVAHHTPTWSYNGIFWINMGCLLFWGFVYPLS